jgi:hypothetical protein
VDNQKPCPVPDENKQAYYKNRNHYSYQCEATQSTSPQAADTDVIPAIVTTMALVAFEMDCIIGTAVVTVVQVQLTEYEVSEYPWAREIVGSAQVPPAPEVVQPAAATPNA